MRLVVLGAGGWIPTPERETSAALIVDGAEAVLLDAGTGVRRLVDAPALLAGVRRLTVVLTHYHLDHTIGLAYLPAVRIATGVELEVVGPGRRAYDEDAATTLARLLSPPLFAAGVERTVGAVADLPDGPLERGRIALAWRVQERHPQPTVAYRLGDALAWCTDTAPDPATAPFARGVRHLFHEGMRRHDAPSDGHTSPAEAAAIARDAGARLVLIHADPLRPAAQAEEEARAVLPGSSVARDLDALDLDGAG